MALSRGARADSQLAKIPSWHPWFTVLELTAGVPGPSLEVPMMKAFQPNQIARNSRHQARSEFGKTVFDR